MNGKLLCPLSVCWVICMAEIYRSVLISDELYPLVKHADIPAQEQIALQPENVINPAETDNTLELYHQGLADGIAQENTRLREEASMLSSLINTIPEVICENRQQLASEIADIVMLVTSKLFIHQQQNKTTILQQINQIIDQINTRQNLEIALHPHDLALIQHGEITLDLRDCKNLRLKADESLRLGGCVITSEHGVFDGGIERQIDNLKRALLQLRSRT